MKPFIRIGNLYLNVSDIIEVDADYKKTSSVSFDTAQVVRVTTRALDYRAYLDGAAASESCVHDFAHGTPEAEAIIAWLEAQSLPLL